MIRIWWGGGSDNFVEASKVTNVQSEDEEEDEIDMARNFGGFWVY